MICLVIFICLRAGWSISLNFDLYYIVPVLLPVPVLYASFHASKLAVMVEQRVLSNLLFTIQDYQYVLLV